MFTICNHNKNSQHKSLNDQKSELIQSKVKTRFILRVSYQFLYTCHLKIEMKNKQ